MQQAIVGALRARAGLPVTTEVLRWEIAAPVAVETDFPNLDRSINSSFQRACGQLEESGQIEITKRRLRSLHECAANYPCKTLHGEIRRLRSIFLPTLCEWQQQGQLRPKYNTGDNEEHFLDQLRKDKENFQPLIMRWRSIREELRPHYGSASQPSEALLRLICKGTELFRHKDSRPPGVWASGSFTSAVDAVCEQGLVPVETQTHLRVFLGDFLPLWMSDELKFRSYIHAIVEVVKGGPYKMRNETSEWLREKHPNIVENLPGYKHHPRNQRNGIQWPWETEYTYPSVFNSLFDHTVFEEFRFVALT